MAKKEIMKSPKAKLTLIEKARLLLECFDGDVYGPKDQIVFKIDSPDWALKIMVNFGFGGKGPNIITTSLIMEICHVLSLYPKSSKLQALEEVIEDYISHSMPAAGEMIEWLRVVPSSWDYLTKSIAENKGSSMRAEAITLIAYRNYQRFIASKLVEALISAVITK